MTEILVVFGEPLSPADHGGRIRAISLARALARRFEVCVLAPGPAPAGLEHEVLPGGPRPAPRRAMASLDPAVGRAMLPPQRRDAVADAARRRRPDIVLFAQSWLAAMAPPLAVDVIVDFQDVEVHRLASLSRRGRARTRLAWTWEYAKALRWEPRVARRAALAVAVSSRDAARLAAWGADVVCVPHGADRLAPVSSPATGPVTCVASMAYGPNVDGVRFLLDEVWPLVRARRPDIPLRIVGSRAEQVLGWRGGRDGIEVISDAVDVDRFYAEAALVVAPVRVGGGAQVKVIQALARARIVVATPYSLLSAPTGAAGAVVAADSAERFAEIVVRLWRDVDERRALERLLEQPLVPSWEQAALPLVAQVERIVRQG